jgi:hypothetical protein
MTRILTLTILTLISATVLGQNNTESLQNNVLLKKFCTELRIAVNTKDKAKLATLCSFPFYCRPCIGDTTIKVKNHGAIKVSRALFYESQFKLFFDKPFKEKVNSDEFKPSLFQPAYNEKNQPRGFSFPYTIVAPSKNWEGLQGFVYLEKVTGQYKITGIDTVP